MRYRLAGAGDEFAAEAVMKARRDWPYFSRDAVVGVGVRVKLGKRGLQVGVVAVTRTNLDPAAVGLDVMAVRSSGQDQVRIAGSSTGGTEHADEDEEHKQLPHDRSSISPLCSGWIVLHRGAKLNLGRRKRRRLEFASGGAFMDLTDVEPTDAYTPDSDGLVIELDENVVMTFWTSLLARVLARRRAERLS
jgi:hypothetical protein